MPRHETEKAASLVDAWGVRPGLRVWVGGNNVQARTEVERHVTGAERPPTGDIDLGLITPLTSGEALHFAGKLRPRLLGGAMVWIVYPTPRTPGGDAFAAGLDEMIVGMFERGFGEAGRGVINDQLAMSGFRFEGGPEEF